MSLQAPTRNLRHALASIVPNWLANVPGLNVGYAVLYCIALLCDCLIEVMFEGLYAAYPGKGDSSALPYIGKSRGFGRFTGETDDAYAARLRAWLTTWPEAGSDELLVRLIQQFLGGGLVVRAVDRRGRFTTIDGAGNITIVSDATWNFDATELPARVGWWSDLWVIVYLDTRWPVYTTLGDAAWIAGWGTYTGDYGFGHQVPRSIPSDLKTLLAEFKGAHMYIEAIVFTTDTALFIPGSLTAGFPNGRWGNWSRPIAGTQTPARAITSNLRYWVPDGGA